MNEADASFGAWLQRRRRALDLTQAELARRVGVAAATIRKIEADARRPSPQVAARLADQLAIPPGERAAFLRAARAEQSVEHLAAPAVPATRLPDGMVTLLQTEIASGDRIWEHDRHGLPQALARHDAILREAIAAHGGAIVHTTGAGFAVAFARPIEAVEAALAAQRGLLALKAQAVPLRVRMALHTAMVEITAGSYHGLALYHLARLAAAGHGGQILLDHVTATLVRDRLPRLAVVRNLGAHQLHAGDTPEPIFQLSAPDLPAAFPPLAARAGFQGALPQPLTPLIGREHEVAAISGMLRRAAARLVTLTGPGGVGKTRVALQVAAALRHDFADGAVFVTLAAVIDPAQVAPAITQALGLRDSGGTPMQELHAMLRERQILLVLDNFEQVLDAAPEIVALLLAAPGVSVLITSRAALRVSGEHEYRIPPLPLPPTPDRHGLAVAPGGIPGLASAPAVRLFVERAQAVQPGFALTSENAPAVTAICAHLDGLPLAIELAAARTRLFTPEALLDRLLDRQDGARLHLLAAGARDLPERQQTLRATMDWSYALLGEHERVLFRRLGVFRGGWTLEAAQTMMRDRGLEIGDDDQSLISNPSTTLRTGLQSPVLDRLATLIDQSLIAQEAGWDSEPRFGMLETIREYALERLTGSGEAQALHGAHARYYFNLAQVAAGALHGPAQESWLRRLEAEHANLAEALAWALDGADVELGARLATALAPFWWRRGHVAAGQRWLDRALAHGPALAPAARAELLAQAGWFAWLRGAYAEATTHAHTAHALGQEFGDAPTLGMAGATLGMVAWYQGDSERATTWLVESLARFEQAGDRWGQAHAWLGLGLVAYNQGDHARRVYCLGTSLALYRACGDSAGIAAALLWMANIAVEQGELAGAVPLYEEALARYRGLDDTGGAGHVLHKLGDIAHDRGELERAVALFSECLALLRRIGDTQGIGDALIGLGDVAFKQGNLEWATDLFSEALALIRERGNPIERAWAIRGLARVAHTQGNDRRAHALFTESLELARIQGNPWGIAVCLEGLAGVLAAQGQAPQAARLLGAAHALRGAHRLRYVPGSLPDYEQDVEMIRDRLGAAAFDAAFEAGCILTPEQAITEAGTSTVLILD